jgi:cyclophilin family peptidyl-prolyl cis-trans isomerase
MTPEPEPTEEPAASQPEGQQPMQWDSAPAMQLEQGKDYKATIRTNKGEIVVDLFEEEVPVTVNNFVFLAEQGFYTNVPFHRVINGFMIQTGDPTGSGAGGPGYRFADEPVTREYERGIVAMANAGPDTNGSQFFIMHADNPLPKNYTIFGQVVSGLDVVDALATAPVSANARGERSVPNEPLTMESVEITTE